MNLKVSQILTFFHFVIVSSGSIILTRLQASIGVAPSVHEKALRMVALVKIYDHS